MYIPAKNLNYFLNEKKKINFWAVFLNENYRSENLINYRSLSFIHIDGYDIHTSVFLYIEIIKFTLIRAQ